MKFYVDCRVCQDSMDIEDIYDMKAVLATHSLKHQEFPDVSYTVVVVNDLVVASAPG